MRRMLKSLHYLAVALLVVCSVGSVAQTITGGVNGTVTDPSGAIVPNAKISVANIETGVTTTDESNASGQYAIRFLQVGRYKVTINAPGFAPQVLGPFALESGQNAKFDAKLGLEGSKTSLDVNANLVPLINTDSAELGTTLDSTAIDNIPLQGRNFSSLTIFSPGAVATNPSGFTGGNAIERSTGGSGQVSVNGNRQQSNNFLLDGIEINETINNTIGYSPSPDALTQIRVVSANAQAEYGNVNGGDVIALLKSGTNRFHGSAFYYVTNYNLNANGYSNNFTGTPKLSLTSNIFGATIGGPIVRDKLFFFADYSGNRYHSGGATTASVATARMRKGDFGELLTTPGLTPIQLYDTQAGFSPYANNMLPATALNPVARYIFAHPELYPLPNKTPSVGSATSGNYIGTSKNRIYNDQFDAKVDYNYNDKNSMFARYSQSTAGDTNTVPLALQFAGASTYPTKGFAFNYVHTFTPALQNEARIGFFRTVWHQGLPNDSTGVFGTNGNAVVGIGGGNNGFAGFVSQSTGFSTIGNSAVFSDNAMNNYTYEDNLTWQKGKNLIKMGGQFIRYQQNLFYPGNDGGQGTVVFNGNFTQLIGGTCPAATNCTGYGGADFYLNRAISAGRAYASGRNGQRQWRDALFVQDDYHVSQNLVVNLGLRWEYDQPIYEVNDKQVNLDLNTGAFQFAGKNGNSRALYDAVYTNFMPRVGFAYNATPRIVVRGGFGMTTYLEGTGANLRLPINPPFVTSYSYSGTAPSAGSSGTFATEDTAFLNAGQVCATATNPSCSNIIRAWDKKLKPSTVEEYSFTTEYQVSNTASLQLGYVGEHAYHLIQAQNGNQVSSPCLSATGTILGITNPACFAVNKTPFYTVAGQNGFVRITQSYGMMNYNALQASYRQRIKNGLQFLVNYAYSKSLSNSIGFFGVSGVSGGSAFASDPKNFRQEYGPAGTDVTHNINFNTTYDLPFGKGKMFGGGVNRVVDELIGGWKVSVSGFVYSGFPITITNTANNSGVNASQQRPNHLRTLKVVNRDVNHWFGTDPSATACGQSIVAGNSNFAAGRASDNGVCAYGYPTDGTIGNSRPNTERAPGYQQYDASAFKEFSVTDSQRVSFRVDGSNVFNISSYGQPDRTAQSATFGRITSTRNAPRQLQLSAKYIF